MPKKKTTKSAAGTFAFTSKTLGVTDVATLQAQIAKQAAGEAARIAQVESRAAAQVEDLQAQVNALRGELQASQEAREGERGAAEIALRQAKDETDAVRHQLEEARKGVDKLMNVAKELRDSPPDFSPILRSVDHRKAVVAAGALQGTFAVWRNQVAEALNDLGIA